VHLLYKLLLAQTGHHFVLDIVLFRSHPNLLPFLPLDQHVLAPIHLITATKLPNPLLKEFISTRMNILPRNVGSDWFVGGEVLGGRGDSGVVGVLGEVGM